jgi:hypothetical protein
VVAGVAVDGDDDWTHPPIRTQSMRIMEMRTRKHFFIPGNLSRHRLILLFSHDVLPANWKISIHH